MKSGASYCSQSELSAIFGVGNGPQIDAIEVKWPSGTVDRLANVKPNQLIVVEEGKKK